MKKRKVIFKVVLVVALLFAMNFDSCKKDDCWTCYLTNPAYGTQKVCDESAKNSLVNQGYTCNK